MQDNLYNETLKDKFTLSPFQKYEKYGRLPYKFLLGCALVFLTSCQVIFVSEYYSYNNPSQMQQWAYLLLQSDDPQNNRIVFLTVSDFQESLQNTLKTLQTINEITIQDTQLKGKVTLQSNYNYPYDQFLKNIDFQYEVDIDTGITQPFDLESAQSIKSFWLEAQALMLIIENIQVTSEGKKICWNIHISYKYTDQGFISAEIIALGGVCIAVDIDDDSMQRDIPSQNGQINGNQVFSENQLGWDSAILQILIIGIASFDMILGVKYIYEVIEMYTNNIYKQSRMRKFKVPEYKLYKNQNLTTLKLILKEQKPWDQLTLNEKLLFFDLFLPLRILGNICQIIASSVLLTEGFVRIDELSTYDEIFSGMGCFFAWFAMVKYLDYYEELHLIASVLESSIIPLCNAILNFLPVFFAYIFLGMCLFSDSRRFATLQCSVATLVALIYGDSISDVIRDSSRSVRIEISLIFMCSYILLFTFAVNNIMIALIREQQEMKRDLIQMEKDLMNQLDIQPGSRMDQSVTNEIGLRKQSSQILPERINASVGGQQQSQKRQASFRQIAQLAVLLNRKDQPVNQKDLEKDWRRVAKQEMQKNYIYNALIQTVRQLKDILTQVEKEVWSDIDSLGLELVDRKEVITLFCSQLIYKHQKLREMIEKVNRIENDWKIVKSQSNDA